MKVNSIERLKKLEDQVNVIGEQIKSIADTLNKLNNFNLLLTKRINAIVRAGDKGDITSDTYREEMELIEESRLKSILEELKKQGVLVESQDEITEQSFIVCREYDCNNNLVNKRFQYPIQSINEEHRGKFLGKKVGEEIIDAETQNRITIDEVYQIVELTGEEIKGE